MSLSKTAQIEADYRRVTKRYPWLIPVTWAAPRPLEDYNEIVAKARNHQLRRAYQQRRRRAVARAKAVVEASTRDLNKWPGHSPDLISKGVPKVATPELPRGWRSRELRGHRRAPSSFESIRKKETARRRSALRVSGWGPPSPPPRWWSGDGDDDL
jgi:hypothetical protein